jgi:pyruvate/2-oxoglutarate dehydrogenase complex dihydrolipoamide dehydrogenase (E3) component
MLKCQYLVIGSGETGLTVAKNLARMGYETILAEQAELGGSFLQSLETPKRLLTHKASKFNHSLELFKSNPNTFAALRKHRRKLNEQIKNEIQEKQKHLRQELEKLSNLTWMEGQASFSSKHLVDLNSAEERHLIGFDQAVLAVGKNEVLKPTLEGFDEANFLFRYNAFLLPEIPNHLAILGMSLESLEVANLYAALGVKVTIYDSQPSAEILPKLDRSCFNYLLQTLSFRGVVFKFDTHIQKIHKKRTKTYLIDQDEEEYEFSHIYTEFQENFNAEGLNLETLNIKTTDKGITTNHLGQTKQKHIWALGTCNSHTQTSDKSVLIHNFLEKQKPSDKQNLNINPLKVVDYFAEDSVKPIKTRVLKVNTYCPVVTIGKSEKNARALYGNYVQVQIIDHPLWEGFLKIIYKGQEGAIIGLALAGDFCTYFEEYGIVSLRRGINLKQLLNYLKARNVVS